MQSGCNPDAKAEDRDPSGACLDTGPTVSHKAPAAGFVGE